MPRRFGISGNRAVSNPVGTTGLIGAISTLIVSLLLVFDVDIEVEAVAAVLAGIWGIVSAIIFRQPSEASQLPPPPPPSD